MLSLNINIIKKLIISFTFFFKMYNVIIFFVTRILLDIENESNHSNDLSTVVTVFNVIVLFIIVTLMATSDGWNVNRYVKFFLLLILFLFFIDSWASSHFDTGNDVIYHIFEYDISIKNRFTSAVANLWLFFGREAYLQLRFRHSNKK